MTQFAVDKATFRGPSAVNIQLTGGNLPTNAEVTDDESGSLYAETQSLTYFGPTMNGTSKAIGALLNICPQNGQCIGAAEQITHADIFERNLKTCQSSESHLQHTCQKGLMRLQTLSAPRRSDATLSFLVDALADGANAPIAVATGVSLPTVIVQRYRLGVCKIAGVTFTEIADVSIEFNVGITEKDPQLAEIFPQTVGVITVRPVLVLRGQDLSQFRTTLIELGANAATHANTLFQLRKLQDSGSYVDAATAEHIAITMAGLAVPDSLASGSGSSRATNELRLPTRYDGVNTPLLINTSATYNASP